MNHNYLGILLAAGSAFVLGGLWYGPLFGKLWAEQSQLIGERLEKRKIPVVFITAFILSLIASFTLANFVGEDYSAVAGAMAGAAAGIGWTATFFGIVYLFEARTFKHFAINAGYAIIALTLMGTIIGATN